MSIDFNLQSNSSGETNPEWLSRRREKIAVQRFPQPRDLYEHHHCEGEPAVPPQSRPRCPLPFLRRRRQTAWNHRAKLGVQQPKDPPDIVSKAQFDCLSRSLARSSRTLQLSHLLQTTQNTPSRTAIDKNTLRGEPTTRKS